MVDRAVVAEKIASVRDAVARIRDVLPAARDAFRADRTVREVVILNLFVALQECLSLAAHWLSDAGLDVPQSDAQVFLRLGERGIVAPDLAARLAAASGLRNLELEASSPSVAAADSHGSTSPRDRRPDPWPA